MTSSSTIAAARVVVHRDASGYRLLLSQACAALVQSTNANVAFFRGPTVDLVYTWI